MAAITLTNNAIYSQKINNFSGELFRVGGQRTPFLSATGGLNGGKVLQSTFWQIQAADSHTVSSEPTKGQEGAQPTEYLGRDRVAFTGVTQVFHKGVKMTYTAMATFQHQNPFDLSANIINSSDGDGTVTAADKLSLAGGNPIVDEFSEQLTLALEKVAREVEWFAFNGTFADGANTTPGSGTREMRGLSEYIALNANAKKWTLTDYLMSHVKLGNKEYQLLEWFVKTYNFNIPSSCAMLNGKGYTDHHILNSFKKGDFKIKDLEWGKTQARRILWIGEFFQYYKKRNFIDACLSVFQNKTFDWKLFKKRLENNSAKLKNQGSRNEFIINIERIYNTGTSAKYKIRLELYDYKR